MWPKKNVNCEAKVRVVWSPLSTDSRYSHMQIAQRKLLLTAPERVIFGSQYILNTQGSIRNSYSAWGRFRRGERLRGSHSIEIRIKVPASPLWAATRQNFALDDYQRYKRLGG